MRLLWPQMRGVSAAAARLKQAAPQAVHKPETDGFRFRNTSRRNHRAPRKQTRRAPGVAGWAAGSWPT